MDRAEATNVSFAAIQLYGENLSVRRVHAINWGNNSYAAPGPDPDSVETFVIGLSAGDIDPQSWLTVEGCIVDHPMKGTDHANAVPIIITAGSGQVYNGYVINNYIDGKWEDIGYEPETNFITALQVLEAHNLIVQGNHIANCQVGMYMDTGQSDEIAITGNAFRNLESGLYYILSAGENVNMFRISGNIFEINAKGSPYSMGVYVINEVPGEISITNMIVTGII